MPPLQTGSIALDVHGTCGIGLILATAPWFKLWHPTQANLQQCMPRHVFIRFLQYNICCTGFLIYSPTLHI